MPCPYHSMYDHMDCTCVLCTYFYLVYLPTLNLYITHFITSSHIMIDLPLSDVQYCDFAFGTILM